MDLVKIIKVVDGDTVHVQIIGSTYPISSSTKMNTILVIRLRGIDTPELAQEWGTASKNWLANTLEINKDKILLSREIQPDRYGRTLGSLFVVDLKEGIPVIKDIQLEMIRNGHAWWYKTYNKNPHYKKAMELAVNKNIGLWADEKTVAPWEFRRLSRFSNKLRKQYKEKKINFKQVLEQISDQIIKDVDNVKKSEVDKIVAETISIETINDSKLSFLHNIFDSYFNILPN